MNHREMLEGNRAGLPVPDCDGRMHELRVERRERGAYVTVHECFKCLELVETMAGRPIAVATKRENLARFLSDLARAFKVPDDRNPKGPRRG